MASKTASSAPGRRGRPAPTRAPPLRVGSTDVDFGTAGLVTVWPRSSCGPARGGREAAGPLRTQSWPEYIRSRAAADLGTIRSRSVADAIGLIRRRIRWHLLRRHP